jgi:hypothetical protein
VLGKNASDICFILSEAYGGEAVEKTNVSEWREELKECSENMEDDERNGHPTFHRINENFETVRNLMHSDSQPNLLSGNIEGVT